MIIAKEVPFLKMISSILFDKVKHFRIREL